MCTEHRAYGPEEEPESARIDEREAVQRREALVGARTRRAGRRGPEHCQRAVHHLLHTSTGVQVGYCNRSSSVLIGSVVSTLITCTIVLYMYSTVLVRTGLRAACCEYKIQRQRWKRCIPHRQPDPSAADLQLKLVHQPELCSRKQIHDYMYRLYSVHTVLHEQYSLVQIQHPLGFD